MLAKFAEAVRLLFANLVLFSAIILTVWLPGNLFTNYLLFYSPVENDPLRAYKINSFLELVFHPIAIGALIHALATLKAGRRPSYSESISAGFRNWGRLFVVQLLTSLLIGVASILLVIPGIILAVRYALVYPVAVLERAGTDRARRRSTELTRGVRWQIFWAGLLFIAVYVPLSFLIYAPLESFAALDTMATGVALDCVVDIAYVPIQIVMFLYYWQAIEREKAAPGPATLA